MKLHSLKSREKHIDSGTKQLPLREDNLRSSAKIAFA